MALNWARPRGAALAAGLSFLMFMLVVAVVAWPTSRGEFRLPSLTSVSVAGSAVLRLDGTVRRTDTDGRRGFEQTFTIRRPPASAGPVIVSAGRLAPRLRARLDAGVLTVSDGNGRVLARYGGLHVTDAAGRVLPSRIELHAGRVSLAIAAHSARYPLHVDPYVQIATLTPSAADSQLGAENGDRSKYGVRDTFGDSVAESANGDVLAVGAPADNSVFVFVKPAHGGWKDAHPVARLETNVQAQYPELGESVAVSANGKTIVAGEPQTSIGSGQQNGEALVYTEPSNGWQHATGSPKAWLSAADTTAYFDWFGASVAINAAGDTIVIGAPGWKSEEGAIYVFKKGNHDWKPASGDVTANVGEAGGNSDYGGAFGQSVSMSSNGDVIAVGAPGQQGWEGAVYVFGHDGDGYRELADTASGTSDSFFICDPNSGYGIGNPELGTSVAVSSDGKTITAGEPCAGTGGQAVVYTEPSHGWDSASGLITAGLTPLRPDALQIRQLGANVAISGDASTIVADDPDFPSTGGYLDWSKRPAHGWSHVNPPVAANFGSILTSSSLAGGIEDLIAGNPLAVSSGGGLIFAGTAGSGNRGSVNVYELASDIGSATTVSCSPSSVDTGKQSTCTATVKTKSPTATGEVSFSSTGGSAAHFSDKQCTLKKVKSGTASCHVKFTPDKRQSYTIRARYEGDDNHGSGTGTTIVDTPKDGTSMHISCAQSTVTATSSVECTAKVTGAGSGSPAVGFKTSPAAAGALGAVVCSQQGSTKTCTVDITIQASGVYKITGAYDGDSLDGASDASVNLTVAAALTSTIENCSPTAIATNQTTNCSATVSGLVGTATPPEISFTANAAGWSFGREMCTVSGGSETCSAAFTPAATGGNYRIDATFPGDASSMGSAGEVAVSVTTPTTAVLSCSLVMAKWTCTTTVADTLPTGISPSGTITVTGGSSSVPTKTLGTCTLVAASASASGCAVTFSPTPPNAYTLTASYPGDAAHQSSNDTITYSHFP
jgi:hypothetical protein